MSIGRESEGWLYYLVTTSKVNNCFINPSFIISTKLDYTRCAHNEWTTDEMSSGIKEWSESMMVVVHYPLNKYVLCVLSFILSFMTPALFVSYLLLHIVIPVHHRHDSWSGLERVIMKESPELHCHRGGFILNQRRMALVRNPAISHRRKNALEGFNRKIGRLKVLLPTMVNAFYWWTGF